MRSLSNHLFDILMEYYLCMGWFFYAVLSAFFAAVTSILMKVGLRDVNSNLATAIRTIVVLLFAWGVVFLQGNQKNLSIISKTSMIFLILSGLATGLSWLFYFRALQLGDVSKVVPVDKLSIVFALFLAAFVLKESLSIRSVFGILLIVGGTLLAVF